MRAWFAAAVAVLIAAGFLFDGVGVANAASVPFTDPSASGFIGFCDRSGNAITSGSVDDAPFVWTSVSSAAAPSGYAKGKATLLAYQPRQGVPPDEWSGEAMTASSTYTNAAHPMAQATNGDQPLISFVGAFPPNWDGLVQLRMIFSAVNLPDYNSTYPATVIKVSGSKWKVVEGGTADCHSGTAISAESQQLTASQLATPQAVIVNGKTTVPSPPASTTPGVSGSSPSASGAQASASSSGSSSSTGLIIGLVAAAAVVLGGCAFFYRRRAGGTGAHS